MLEGRHILSSCLLQNNIQCRYKETTHQIMARMKFVAEFFRVRFGGEQIMADDNFGHQ